MYVCEVSGDVTTCRHKPSVRVPFRIGKKAKQFKKVSYIACRHTHTHVVVVLLTLFITGVL